MTSLHWNSIKAENTQVLRTNVLKIQAEGEDENHHG